MLCSVLLFVAFAEPTHASSVGDVVELMQVTAAQERNGTLFRISKDDCLRAPQCLDPDDTCITEEHRVTPTSDRPECSEHDEFCGEAVYELPSTHLKITLPIMSQETLGSLYAQEYGGQMDIDSPDHWRPTQQAEMVMGAFNDTGASGLRIVEMGCASGYLLYNLKALAGNGGELLCFEGDPDHHAKLQENFDQAADEVEGLKARIIKDLFAPGVLEENSVDIFLSSHTLEHFADPCPWLDDMKRALKPGGLIFTEVPDQDDDPKQGLVRGQFHLLYFKEETFTQMMEHAGFERMSVYVTDQRSVRTIFRKPTVRLDRAGSSLNRSNPLLNQSSRALP